MINFTYPMLNRQMNDCVASKQYAIEVFPDICLIFFSSMYAERRRDTKKCLIAPG